MTGRQKLENLSYSWYGYAVVGTLASLLTLRASGILSLVVGVTMWTILNGIGLAVSLGFITFFSRRLLARSQGMRLFLLVVSGVFTVLGALSTLQLAVDFLRMWQLALLVRVVLCASTTLLNARSFGVLCDRAVKSYCSR